MSLTLGQKQRLFMRLLPRLIDRAHEIGFECSEGDAYRDPRVHGPIGVKLGYGHPRSAHKNKLAFDLNLYRDVDDDGDLDYLEATERHRQLGEWWEKQHELCRWGGRFPTPDGNHYSLFHEGVS